MQQQTEQTSGIEDFDMYDSALSLVEAAKLHERARAMFALLNAQNILGGHEQSDSVKLLHYAVKLENEGQPVAGFAWTQKWAAPYPIEGYGIVVHIRGVVKNGYSFEDFKASEQATRRAVLEAATKAGLYVLQVQGMLCITSRNHAHALNAIAVMFGLPLPPNHFEGV